MNEAIIAIALWCGAPNQELMSKSNVRIQICRDKVVACFDNSSVTVRYNCTLNVRVDPQ